jgi:uncharacterized protein YutE (UPF0331/DUF86 family)
MQPVWSSSRALPCAWNRFGIELERAAAYSGVVGKPEVAAMKYNGVIQRKIERIAENTRKLRSILPVSSPRLVSDFFLRSGIERTLQVSVEAMIDVANRICSLENQLPASDSYQSLCALAELGVIAQAERYRDMIRFRNFMVHRYENVDPENIVAILSHHLGDFDAFVKEIESYEG